jgi:beta-lactamase regulating signal transducer with metallopeptidase domain
MSFDVLTNDLVDTIGWTLFHSIWQIALAAAALFILLKSIPRAAAGVRYAVSVTALCISMTVPVITFVQVSSLTPSVNSPILGRHMAGDESGPIEPDLVIASISSRDPEPGVSDARGSRGVVDSIFAVTEFVREQLPFTFPFVIAVWVLGVALLSLILSGGLWKLSGYKRYGTAPANDGWQMRLADLCRSLKVSRPVTLMSSELLGTPIAVGIIKPMIIIPASVFLQMNPQQLETIIAHELIHIRRYDCLINVLQGVAEIVFFYHPALWWISKQVRLEREFSADAAVLKLASDGITYATALADLEELRLAANMTVPSNAMAANGGNLMQRITRILNEKTETSRASSAWSAGLAFAVISILLLTLFSFSPRSVVNGQKLGGGEKKIAIGFVGIPPIDRSENAPKDAFATAQLLMNVLKTHSVPATGFVIGSSVSDGDRIYPVRAEIVKMWRDQGFDVGVGGFRHLSFYDTPYDEYVANTEKDITAIKKVLGSETSPRFFSYPFLNTGKTTADRDRFESWLATQKLSSVKYTVDNQEWMYSFAYDMARNDNDINTMKEIKASFIDYMTRMFDHFETYSHEMFGRDIAQTMVLTPSRLVADTGNDLFGILEKRGYKFVAIGEAQSDPAYQAPESFMGKFGISWFERWQKTQGKPLLDEPDPDAYVVRTWDTKRPDSSK